ncbi:hypothetical protein EV127DRAFT_409479 [Xylaria flabelliformis]|nr:hypothetical protein EV127DRAFT_409479 [Xylaria flabelliformis]
MQNVFLGDEIMECQATSPSDISIPFELQSDFEPGDTTVFSSEKQQHEMIWAESLVIVHACCSNSHPGTLLRWGLFDRTLVPDRNEMTIRNDYRTRKGRSDAFHLYGRRVMLTYSHNIPSQLSSVLAEWHSNADNDTRGAKTKDVLATRSGVRVTLRRLFLQLLLVLYLDLVRLLSRLLSRQMNFIEEEVETLIDYVSACCFVAAFCESGKLKDDIERNREG